MIRGKKRSAMISDTKKIAVKMASAKDVNTENPDIAYDLMVFKPGPAIIMKVVGATAPFLSSYFPGLAFFFLP